MKIQYIVGNLLTTDCYHILQGCNAQGAMGSGVAKVIFDVYPMVREDYIALSTTRKLILGEAQYVDVPPVIISGVQYPARCVINGITQEYYAKHGDDPNTVYVSYDAIADVTKHVSDMILQEYEVTETFKPRVALPLIGAGLARGDWSLIATIIEDLSGDIWQPVVYVQTQEQLDSILK